MDSELRQYLDAKFAEMDGKLAEMDGKFASKHDLEKVETALLTEFHKWASPAELRAKSHAAALRAFDLELEAITERVQKLENGRG